MVWWWNEEGGKGEDAKLKRCGCSLSVPVQSPLWKKIVVQRVWEWPPGLYSHHGCIGAIYLYILTGIDPGFIIVILYTVLERI